MALGGLKLKSLESCHIALTGADCNATVTREGWGVDLPVPVNEVTMLEQGDELTLGLSRQHL